MSNESRTKIDPLIGQVVQGRYRILRTIGADSMGTVYVAEQLSTGQRVAVKMLSGQYARDEEFIGRFRQAAQQAVALSHDRVVTTYECGQVEDGKLFIAMEYVTGKPLKEVILEGPLPVDRAVALGIQVAEALQAAHKAGIIHRDVKPENIIVRAGDEIKLMGFGLAYPRNADARMAQTGVVVGTSEYLAPEQIEGGELTERTDLYAWGIVFYEMLTGKVPFSAPTPAATVAKHLQEPPQPVRQLRPDVPATSERVVMQALEKKPQTRQRNMGEVIAQLRGEAGQATGGGLSGTRIASQPPKAEGPSNTWLLRGAALFGIVVVSAVVVWFVALRKGDNLSKGGSGGKEEGAAVVVPEAPKSPEKSVKSQEKVPALESVPPQEKELATPKVPAPVSVPPQEKQPTPPEEKKPGVADHLRIGSFYMDRGQYEEAVAQFEAAKALAPNDQAVLTSLARAQKALEAESRIRRAR
ncbi:MAG: protein kinase [Deltaproteobacteria bacterium]|nr:protein kinase [Deltaproteobacteria bacterium]